jgi:hypothetical protein
MSHSNGERYPVHARTLCASCRCSFSLFWLAEGLRREAAFPFIDGIGEGTGEATGSAAYLSNRRGCEKPVGRKVEGLGTYSYKPLPLPEYDSEMRPLRRRDAVIPLLLLLPAAPPPAAARPPKKVRALPPPAFLDDPGSEWEPEASDGSSLHEEMRGNAVKRERREREGEEGERTCC